jgi:hypothetical protein
MTSRQFTPGEGVVQGADRISKSRNCGSFFGILSCEQGYNECVAVPFPSKRAPSGAVPTQPGDDRHRHHHAAYAAEASGLLVIAILLLILVLIRYWPYIPWGAR